MRHKIVGTRQGKNFGEWEKTYFSLSPYPPVIFLETLPGQGRGKTLGNGRKLTLALVPTRR
ncbi:hypothetical protein [Microseira sp. BLCC-F43]|uniref:hypothetical protein n=1 Tax=Microseira sp. BLCC-F43 TaxID=3153602 RepID=UPI0035B91E88